MRARRWVGRHRTLVTGAAAALLVLLFGLIAFGTLRGCFYLDPQEAAKLEEERKKKEEEEKKREFEVDFPAVQPSEPEGALQHDQNAYHHSQAGSMVQLKAPITAFAT